MQPDTQVVTWLLAQSEPALSYRVYTEVLDKAAEDPVVIAAKSLIPESETVSSIFSAMHPDGYWLQKDYKGHWAGDGVAYGSFGTTHFVLGYLAELGMDRQDARIEKASDRYLNLQQEDGTWQNHQSCLYALNIRTFTKLGYRQDARLQRAIDFLLSVERPDGGYLCDMHEGKYKTRATKSCIRGCAKAILAFAELPEYWQHPACLRLVDYYLRREVLWRTKQPDRFVNGDMPRAVYPIIWRSSFWEPIYALSKMGYGAHPAMQRAWDFLETRMDEMGRLPLDFTPVQATWKVGNRGEPNPWLTLYAQLAKKYKHMQLHSTENVG
jgi:hypothetical protein